MHPKVHSQGSNQLQMKTNENWNIVQLTKKETNTNTIQQRMSLDYQLTNCERKFNKRVKNQCRDRQMMILNFIQVLMKLEIEFKN